MKTPIFQAPTCIVPSTNLVFPRLQPCQFEAPTSRAPTLSLVQAPTWFLEDSNPLGRQPCLPRHRPCLYEAPTSCFISSRYIWLYLRLPMSSSTSPDILQLTFHCNLHITSHHQLQPCLLMKVSP